MIYRSIIRGMAGAKGVTDHHHVLLQKLIVTQLVKKFPAFNGTRRFVTVFTTARHWSLSSARSIHPILFL
jgi:hypothetical protein